MCNGMLRINSVSSLRLTAVMAGMFSQSSLTDFFSTTTRRVAGRVINQLAINAAVPEVSIVIQKTRQIQLRAFASPAANFQPASPAP